MTKLVNPVIAVGMVVVFIAIVTGGGLLGTRSEAHAASASLTSAALNEPRTDSMQGSLRSDSSESAARIPVPLCTVVRVVDYVTVQISGETVEMPVWTFQTVCRVIMTSVNNFLFAPHQPTSTTCGNCSGQGSVAPIRPVGP